MSNQSVIYNPDGTINQTITGKVINTLTPTVSVTQMPDTFNVTFSDIATATPLPANVTDTPAKGPSTGLVVLLGAIFIIAAIALVPWKKK
jgi:hypothetical protein